MKILQNTATFFVIISTFFALITYFLPSNIEKHDMLFASYFLREVNSDFIVATVFSLAFVSFLWIYKKKHTYLKTLKTDKAGYIYLAVLLLPCIFLLFFVLKKGTEIISDRMTYWSDVFYYGYKGHLIIKAKDAEERGDIKKAISLYSIIEEEFSNDTSFTKKIQRLEGIRSYSQSIYDMHMEIERVRGMHIPAKSNTDSGGSRTPFPPQALPIEFLP